MSQRDLTNERDHAFERYQSLSEVEPSVRSREIRASIIISLQFVQDQKFHPAGALYGELDVTRFASQGCNGEAGDEATTLLIQTVVDMYATFRGRETRSCLAVFGIA